MATVRDVLREGPATSEEIALELGRTVRLVNASLCGLVDRGYVRRRLRVRPRDRRPGQWPYLNELVLPEPLERRGRPRGS